MAKRGRPRLTNKIPLQISRSHEPSNSEILNFLKTAVEKKVSNGGQKTSAYGLVGSLPDWAIREFIKEGVIKIDPLPGNWEELVDEVTIDFHLGNVLKVFNREGLDTIDTKHATKSEIEEMMKTVVLKPGQPFILTENDFVIATTKERLTLPNDIVGHLNGKSSLARIGVVIHSTAARFDPGWDGCPVLEFGTFLKGKKIVIYEGSPICAFSFERLGAPVDRSYMERSTSRYGGVLTPVVADEPGVRKTKQ